MGSLVLLHTDTCADESDVDLANQQMKQMTVMLI